MGMENVALVAFNRGIISKKGMARTDIKRTALSAEIQTNFVPRVLGSMSLRPGLQYLGSTKSNKRAFHLPFIFSRSDKALIEFTDLVMRVRVSDAIISRVAVSTAVTSGDFSASTGWTDADESGAASNITGGKLELVGTKFNSAIVKQQVTVGAGDVNKEHALRIVVDRGPVTLRVGSTDGGDDYISETSLGTGTHSLAFTPTGNFWIKLSSLTQAKKIVDSITVEGAGNMELPSPYLEADLRKIRYDESADVIYLACKGYQQRKIERRGTRSWSIVEYEPQDGPFKNINVTTTSISASAIVGDITLTASKRLFKSSNVGSLFKLTSIGQKVAFDATGADQWSNPIKVTGVGASQRTFNIIRSGTWVGTITLQRSVGEVGAWVDVTTYTTNATITYNDALDNQTIYYRIGFKSGNYTSGTASLELNYASGGLTGIVKITGYTDEQTVSAAVLKDLGGTTGTTDWNEGEWSNRRGYPSAVALHEGRLWWAGKTKVIGSISDAYESFDEDVTGDSALINRSIGSGPVDNINWIVSLSRLLIGTDGQEWTARSSSLDEPLTATNFNLKSPSNQGSAEVGAVKLDDTALFVQSSGQKLFRMANTASTNYGYGDYASSNLMELCPEIAMSGILRIAVQRQPDTRVHCLLGDGTVALLINQPAEDVLAWVNIETDGQVEDIVVLPGDEEDEVFYQVARTVNGSTVRYLEKWAQESDCVGGSLNRQADSFVIYDDVPTTTITGLSHLQGRECIVWADGKDKGTHIVTGGSITLDEQVSEAVIGLGYSAKYKSSKLAYAADQGTALTMRKKLDALSLILLNTHYQGLQYGSDFDNMDDLPLVEAEAETAPDTVWEEYDTQPFEFDGTFDSDSRLCIQAAAPRPCTVLALVIGVMTNG